MWRKLVNCVDDVWQMRSRLVRREERVCCGLRDAKKACQMRRYVCSGLRERRRPLKGRADKTTLSHTALPSPPPLLEGQEAGGRSGGPNSAFTTIYAASHENGGFWGPAREVTVALPARPLSALHNTGGPPVDFSHHGSPAQPTFLTLHSPGFIYIYIILYYFYLCLTQCQNTNSRDKTTQQSSQAALTYLPTESCRCLN